MTYTTLTNDEKRCLQMWFRQGIVQAEREEALKNIQNFYNGEAKTRTVHHSPVVRRGGRRLHGSHAKELV